MIVLSRHISRGARSRWLSATLLATAFGLASAPGALAQTAVPQQPTTSSTSQTECTTLHFGLSNPRAGDALQPGGYVLEGFAFDTAATTQQSAGVDRIEIFLDDRDQGGLSLGTAMLGQPNLPFASGGFRLEIKLPELSGGHTLSAYARSSVSGAEHKLSVPIQVGENIDDILPAVAPAAIVPQATCASMPATRPMSPSPATTATTASTAMATSPAAAAPAPAAAATTLPLTTATPLHLALSNPAAGDTLQPGGFELQGTAHDARSTLGGGVDRVQVFLGGRDSGGLFLGEAILGQSTTDFMLSPTGAFSMLVQLPNLEATESLVTYARSAVTGEETIVTIPVQLGAIDDE